MVGSDRFMSVGPFHYMMDGDLLFHHPLPLPANCPYNTFPEDEVQLPTQSTTEKVKNPQYYGGITKEVRDYIINKHTYTN